MGTPTRLVHNIVRPRSAALYLTLATPQRLVGVTLSTLSCETACLLFTIHVFVPRFKSCSLCVALSIFSADRRTRNNDNSTTPRLTLMCMHYEIYLSSCCLGRILCKHYDVKQRQLDDASTCLSWCVHYDFHYCSVGNLERILCSNSTQNNDLVTTLWLHPGFRVTRIFLRQLGDAMTFLLVCARRSSPLFSLRPGVHLV